jgi:hypothetical protein
MSASAEELFLLPIPVIHEGADRLKAIVGRFVLGAHASWKGAPSARCQSGVGWEATSTYCVPFNSTSRVCPASPQLVRLFSRRGGERRRGRNRRKPMY